MLAVLSDSLLLPSLPEVKSLLPDLWKLYRIVWSVLTDCCSDFLFLKSLNTDSLNIMCLYLDQRFMLFRSHLVVEKVPQLWETLHQLVWIKRKVSYANVNHIEQRFPNHIVRDAVHSKQRKHDIHQLHPQILPEIQAGAAVEDLLIEYLKEETAKVLDLIWVAQHLQAVIHDDFLRDFVHFVVGLLAHQTQYVLIDPCFGVDTSTATL